MNNYGKTWTNFSREYKHIFNNREPNGLHGKYEQILKKGLLDHYMKLAKELKIEQKLNNIMSEAT